ncbi:MAG: MFS transporter [Candidatus Aenigmatarchaeota archaeon]
MKTELKILNAASAFSVFAAGLFGPFYAVFIKEIGGGAFIAGSSYSIYAIAAGVLIYFSSRLEDGDVDTQKLVVLGYFLATLGFFGYLFVENPVQMFAVQAIVGVATAVRSPAFDEVYSRNLDEGRYAYEWGVWESMYWVVTGVSAFVAGFIIQNFGFDILFIAMGSFSLIGTAVSAVLVFLD